MGNGVQNDTIMTPYIRTLTPEEAAAERKRGTKIKKLPADWVQQALKQFDKKKPTQMSPYTRTVTLEEIENRKKLEEYMKKHKIDCKNPFKK